MKKFHAIIANIDEQLTELKRLTNYTPQPTPPNKLKKILGYIEDENRFFGVSSRKGGKYAARVRTGNTITCGVARDCPHQASRDAIHLLIDYERARPDADTGYLDELQHKLDSRPW